MMIYANETYKFNHFKAWNKDVDRSLLPSAQIKLILCSYGIYSKVKDKRAAFTANENQFNEYLKNSWANACVIANEELGFITSKQVKRTKGTSIFIYSGR